ncbi:hypothetical protein QJS04_geneDACA008286 [Acorus gramineus]|uniref:Uncharacterized protein n=1 Tax=Acorus gramineus TaxID=55184 RepID=A0AAV9AZ07_ACOGR|nr:hypothetical protein QJS04_geneDACA008286 [Acorus gramineus]
MDGEWGPRSCSRFRHYVKDGILLAGTTSPIRVVPILSRTPDHATSFFGCACVIQPRMTSSLFVSSPHVGHSDSSPPPRQQYCLSG